MFKTASLFLCFLALASAERQLQTTGDHDWAYSLTTAVASFGQATANQFLFTFANGASLTDANAVIETLWDATCTTPVTAGMTASASAVNAAVTTASVSVDFSALGNDVWTATPTAGTLTFCYKSDIQIEGQSMNYVETIVTATFSLVNAFPDITGLDVLDKAAGSSALTAAINYPLLAVPCDASDATLTSPTFAPGSSLRICITMGSTVAGVTLGSVYSAVLTSHHCHHFYSHCLRSGHELVYQHGMQCYTLHGRDDGCWCLLCRRHQGLEYDGKRPDAGWSSYGGGPCPVDSRRSQHGGSRR